MENLKLYTTQLKLDLYNLETKVLYDIEYIFGADKKVTTFSNFISCPKSCPFKVTPQNIRFFFINVQKW